MAPTPAVRCTCLHERQAWMLSGPFLQYLIHRVHSDAGDLLGVSRKQPDAGQMVFDRRQTVVFLA